MASAHHVYNLKISHVEPHKLVYKSLPRRPLPPSVDLRTTGKLSPVYDQKSLGSCTAQALLAAVEYADPTPFDGSQLFLYFNERMMEGTVAEDAGAEISDGIKSLCKHGVCAESLWPYDITKFTERPSEACYTAALEHQALQVKNIPQTAYDMKNCLAQGIPFVVGIVVFAGLESAATAKTGMVPMPRNRRNPLGGHAVLCVGYDDHKKKWIMRNSWGSDWGQAGHFFLPYRYLEDPDLASDLWCIEKMEVVPMEL